jgi:hypothetical protein
VKAVPRRSWRRPTIDLLTIQHAQNSRSSQSATRGGGDLQRAELRRHPGRFSGEDGRSPPSTVLVSLHREAQPRSFSSASGLSSSLDRRRGAWRFSTSKGASGAAGAESRGGRWFRSGGGSGAPNGGGLVPVKTACIAGERPSIPGEGAAPDGGTLSTRCLCGMPDDPL